MLGYQKIEMEEIPTTEHGNSLVEVYIYFSYAKKFIKILSVGDTVDLHRLSSLRTTLNPNLYVKEGALRDAEELKNKPEVWQTTQKRVSDPPSPEKVKHLNKKIREELQDVLAFLRQDPATASEDGALTLFRIEKLADEILDTVAPDIKDLRKFLIGNLKNLMIMEDAAAITSIAVTTAYAHSFDSRALYHDLALACTLMDTPLAEIPVETLKAYYVSPKSVDPKTAELIRQHPVTAAQSISIRIKSFSPTVVQLIVGHHELFNGKGYPKSTRSELLPAAVRSLSMAVDLFEIMKRAQIQGREIDLATALATLRESGTPAHLRRHSQKLVSAMEAFLNPNA